jgi:hypothetical protein
LRGESLGDPRRRLGAEVGLDEHLLQLIQPGLVERFGHQRVADLLGELARGARQALGQTAEPSLAALGHAQTLQASSRARRPS